MRLDEWKRVAPSPACLTDEVYEVLTPVFTALGADPDPECWILWGEDFLVRYSMLAPTPAGLVIVAVRLANGVEDHRATARLVRWSKLSIGEISLESTGGRRAIAVPIENLVLKGTDGEADRICQFCLGLLAAMDGRSWDGAVGAEVPTRAAVPVAPPAPARAAARSHSTLAAPRLSSGRTERAELAEAVRRHARTPTGSTEPDWVPPHSIGAPVTPAPLAKPQPAPKAPSAARQPEPATEAQVWDVPAAKEVPGKKLPPRSWRP